MGAKSKKQVIGYWYAATVHMGLGLAADELYMIKVGGKVAWTGSIKQNSTNVINAMYLFGGEKAEGGIFGNLYAMFGGADQPQNPLLRSLVGNLVPAFRGFVSLVFDGLLCAMNPYPKKWEFAYRRILAGWPDDSPWYPEKALILLANGQIHAMNPAHILYESYISDTWGAGEPRAMMDDAAFKAAADTLYNEGFGLCIEWKITDDLAKFRDTICDHIGARLDTHPLTGLTTITLIRDDYNLADLPVFDEDSGLLEIKFDTSNNTEVPSQVILKYMDAITFEERPAMANNPAVAQAHGGRSVETVDYLAIPTGELATRVAYRILKSKNSSLKRCTVKFDRRAAGIVNGQPFRIKTKRRANNIDIVVRAEKISEGFITDPTITMACLEDVFALPKIAFNPTPPSIGQEQPKPPEPVTERLLVEAPYRELAATIDPANLQLVDNTTCYFFVVAKSPNQSCRSYNLLSRVRGANTFVESDDLGAWCATAVLADDEISYLTTRINIEQPSLLEQVEIGTAAIIDDEIVRIDGIDLLNNQLIIGRGCVDTVPAKHSKGAVIWFYDTFETIDGLEYLPDLTIEAKLITNTATEQLEQSLAPIETITTRARQARPYPPANLKINGLAYPEQVRGNKLQFTWAHRDRLLQADQLIDTTAGDVDLEPNASYSIKIFENGELKASEDGLTATNYTYEASQFLRDRTLLPFDNDFTDLGGAVWQTYGTSTPSIVSADWALNGKCLELDGNSLLKSTSIDLMQLGTNDFVIECFVKFQNSSFIFITDSGVEGVIKNPRIALSVNTNGTLQLLFTTTSTQWQINRQVTGFNMFDGAPHHVVLERYANNLYVYVDGVVRANVSFNYNLTFASDMVLLIGGRISQLTYAIGQLDQFFITPYAKYRGQPFTPPTSPYVFNDGKSANITVELSSTRDSLESWQKYNYSFEAGEV